MRRKALNKKLLLGKETVASLDLREMHEIHGGEDCPPSSLCITLTDTMWLQKITGHTCGD